ncbi:MAG: peptide deformylase, partial [Planctomycetales bacterium]
EEGCLSLPGLHMDVIRPEKVRVEAFTLSGEPIAADLEGFPARVVQHETDHLDGVLFIDRLAETALLSLKDELEEFQINFNGQRERDEIPGDAAILQQLQSLEQERT